MSGIIGQRGIGQRSGVVGPAASTQPAFLCSGDEGTAYTLTATYPYTSANDVTGFAEIFDQANNVTTSGIRPKSIFTAPVTGRYFLSFYVAAEGYGSGNDIMVFLQTSNRVYYHRFDTADVKFSAQLAVVADMDASDTAYIRAVNWQDGGGTLSAGNTWLWFSGYLVA